MVSSRDCIKPASLHGIQPAIALMLQVSPLPKAVIASNLQVPNTCIEDLMEISWK
jgi:hypothetical protein